MKLFVYRQDFMYVGNRTIIIQAESLTDALKALIKHGIDFSDVDIFEELHTDANNVLYDYEEHE